MFEFRKVKEELDRSFNANSEVQLLATIKQNSFLLSSLYERQFAIRPSFSEVPFGASLRCDFCWLSDNSDGPEWVLVEIEKPNIKLFTKAGEPSAELNHAIEQVTSWIRYFDENPTEKSRIFGAVARFRHILVAGRRSKWLEDGPSAWRRFYNKGTSQIEIRTSDIFYDAIDRYSRSSEDFWSFEENPQSLKPSLLKRSWSECEYMSFWRSKFS